MVADVQSATSFSRGTFNYSTNCRACFVNRRNDNETEALIFHSCDSYLRIVSYKSTSLFRKLSFQARLWIDLKGKRNTNVIWILHMGCGSAAVGRRRWRLNVVTHKKMMVLRSNASSYTKCDATIFCGGNHQLDDSMVRWIHDALAVNWHNKIASVEAVVEVGCTSGHYMPYGHLLTKQMPTAN